MRSLAGIACQLIRAVFLHAAYVASVTGVLVFSLLCDLISLGGDAPQFWSSVALYTLAGGSLGIAATALSSATGLPALPDPISRHAARWQKMLSLGAAAVYAVNLWGRIDTGSNRGMPLALSVLALLMLSASGWLGALQHHGSTTDFHAEYGSGAAQASIGESKEEAAKEEAVSSSTSTLL
jgi:uncharacterized membrane protein